MQEKIDEEKEERKIQIKNLNGIVRNLLEQFTVRAFVSHSHHSLVVRKKKEKTSWFDDESS